MYQACGGCQLRRHHRNASSDRNMHSRCSRLFYTYSYILSNNTSYTSFLTRIGEILLVSANILDIRYLLTVEASCILMWIIQCA